jgi:hypothetical protein
MKRKTKTKQARNGIALVMLLQLRLSVYQPRLRVEILTTFWSMARTFSDYIRRTFSDYIWILEDEREALFDITETTMAAEYGTSTGVSELSLLNVSTN